jgi:hypothetical protein
MDQIGELDRVAVLTVDAGNTRVVFQQTTHMTDAPDEGPIDRGHEIQVSVLVRDGRDLVVREDDSTCGVLARSLGAGYRARAVKMCGGIGRYVWNAGRYSRAGAP